MVHALNNVFGYMRLGKARVSELTHLLVGRRSARYSFWLVRYGFAFALLLAAFAVRYGLSPFLGQNLAHAFFIAAALGAAWYGGVGPGLFALFAGLVLGYYYFLPPSHSFGLKNTADTIVLMAYTGATIIGVVIVENLHRVRRRCEHLLRENMEHERVEESLRQSEQRYHELADAMPQMVWTSAEDGKLEYANRRWFEYSGLTEEQTYKPGVWLLIVHPADRDHVIETVRRALQNGQPFKLESRLKDHAGVYRWHLTRALPTKDQSGRVLRWFATSTEIEEQKQTEAALEKAREQLVQHARDLESRVDERTAKLEESLRSLEGVLYHVAHDLRAPLRAMEGFTQLLLEHQATSVDAEGTDYGQRIILAAKRMDELIRDLLAYGRLAHIEVPCRKLDLGAQIDWVLAKMAPEIETKHAEIVVEKPLPSIWANAAVLNLILTNLLSNALKFVGPNVTPQVHVFGECRPGKIRFSIQDNGIGIAEIHHEKIFNVFGSLHGAGAYAGTGIGLAIVRKGVERMGGAVGVESHSGKGSRFWVELPVAPEIA